MLRKATMSALVVALALCFPLGVVMALWTDDGLWLLLSLLGLIVFLAGS